MPLPRKRYKDLYLAEQARNRNLRDEREALRGELRRIRGVLADYAAKELVPDLDQADMLLPKGQPIELYPIGLEGLKAFLHLNLRYTGDDVPLGHGFENYEWKGRRLVCRT